MAPDPAQGFTVKSTQIAEPDAADRQDRFAMTTAHVKTYIVTLWMQRQTQLHVV